MLKGSLSFSFSLSCILGEIDANEVKQSLAKLGIKASDARIQELLKK